MAYCGASLAGNVELELDMVAFADLLLKEGEEFPAVPDEELLVADLTQGMAQLSTAPEQQSTGDGEEEPIDFGS
eukprot:g347.t1